MSSFHQSRSLDCLHLACSSGNVNRCIELIEDGVDVNHISNGISPLHIAAQSSKSELCRLLINNGAKTECSDMDGKTPAFYASRSGNPGALEELCLAGASMDTEVDETTPIHEAAGFGQHRCIEVIFEHDNELIDCFTEDERTPLHRASLEGHLAAVETCLRLGADVHGGFSSEEPGTTPAHLAASRGHESVIRALGAKGANFYLLNEQDQDVFAVAHAHGHDWLFEIMKIFETDADVSADGDSMSVGSSYLQSTPNSNIKFLSKDGVKMPESFQEYKWPWNRKHGF
mmetsp:Transcript_5040/g.6526  ORF Transcript_5040/g.6526 Transcript_5040/m.6526 type:complete len:287 (+) Transcript_5040:50-910(+)